jgi:hypothetical protein
MSLLGGESGNTGNSGNGQAGGSGDAGGGAGGGTAGSGCAGAGGGGNTGGANSWRDALPEDIRANPTLQSFNDIGSLAKSYIHAQGLIGKKGVIPPGEKASDEEWAGFYKQLGLPETLDKYEVKIPDQADKEFVGKFKEMAHKSGILPKQAQALMDWYLQAEGQAVQSRQAQQKQKVEQGIAALRKEWGDGFDKQVALAKLGVREVGGGELAEYLEKTGLGDDPMIVKWAARMGKALGEDKLRGDGAGKFGQTPDEIQAQIDAVMTNTSHPYFDRNHAGHQQAVAQMESLYQKLYKSQSGGT